MLLFVAFLMYTDNGVASFKVNQPLERRRDAYVVCVRPCARARTHTCTFNHTHHLVFTVRPQWHHKQSSVTFHVAAGVRHNLRAIKSRANKTAAFNAADPHGALS